MAIHELNPFDLVSDKVVACFQCTDVGSVCPVVVVDISVWKVSFVFFSVMRVIMPLIRSNPFDLVSEESSRQR